LKHLTVPDYERFLDIDGEFRERWSFPIVIGFMDGKYISIKCSTKAGSPFYNYKQFVSAILQGVADSESKFILTDVGAYGKQSDGGTFPGSILYHFLDNFQSTLAKPAVFE